MPLVTGPATAEPSPAPAGQRLVLRVAPHAGKFEPAIGPSSGGGAFAEGLTINANDRNIADRWVSVMKGFGNDRGTLGVGQRGMDEFLA